MDISSLKVMLLMSAKELEDPPHFIGENISKTQRPYSALFVKTLSLYLVFPTFLSSTRHTFFDGAKSSEAFHREGLAFVHVAA
jgi:hypothetical protein